MISIRQHVGKYVKIVDNNSLVHMGFVSDYDDELDIEHGITIIAHKPLN